MRIAVQSLGHRDVQRWDDNSFNRREELPARSKQPASFHTAVFLAGLVLLLCGGPPARAHQEPPGCTGSGLGISLFTDKLDAHIGETVCYSALVLNTPFPACLAERITASITTPDGVNHPIALRRTTLNPGESDFYTNVVCYVIRAQDVLADGTVRATARDDGLIHQNDTDSMGGGFQGVNTEIAFPCIRVTKQCVPGVGESGAITFTGSVINCGNVRLVNVTVTNFVDGGAFLVLGPISLQTNQAMNFSGSYVPRNPCGPVTDTVIATGTDTLLTPSNVVASATSTCVNALTPGIRLTQSCPPTPVAPGQAIVFSGSVSNTGNVALSNVVVVSDQPVPNTPVFTAATLAPGATANFTGSYTAPTNCATTFTLNARGSSVCGVAVTSSGTSTCPILTAPQITVTAACPTSPVSAGGTLSYSGTVRNGGNITLSNVVVVSDRPAPNTVVFTTATLAPGASANFSGSFTVPANACSISTALTASGRDVCTGNATTNGTSITCPISANPRIAVTLSCPTTPVATGGSITYNGTVSNPGNVTLNNVTVVNNQPVPNTVVLTVPTLAPGASTNFTATFTTPADTCSVSSTVTASGSDACAATIVTNSASATCPLTTTPRIVVTQNCPPNPVGLGGTLTYSGTVSNAGNVTLTNVVVVNDRTGNTPVFAAATLAPGGVANFTGSFTAPTSSGGCSVTSTLTASGSDKCTGTRVTANATSTCPLLGNPSIAVTIACPTTSPAPGGSLTYSGTVRNPGNITLTNVVVVSDRPTADTVIFRAASLGPGASANFTGSFTVPTNDTCSVTTTVRASGNDQCVGAPVTADASATCPVLTTPRIVVTQACPTTSVTPGGTLTYSGTVRNSGNITLTNVIVVSSQPGPNTPVFNVPSLAPGASANFNGSFAVPLDACSVTSTLTASGRDQCTGNTVTNSTTSTCPVVTAPQIAVTKACPAQPATAGGRLVFTGTVTNTGNVTLTGVTVVNNQPAANTTVLGPITLAPGAGTNFTGSYTVPANACSITDTLTASGRGLCGTNVSASTTQTCPVQTSARIVVTQTCPTAPVAPGAVLTFSGTVRNAGDTTLTNVVVVNDQAPGVIVFSAATLAPGATANFTGRYTVPANAVCTSSSTVTATAADRCGGNTITDSAPATCRVLTSPRIAVTQNCPPAPGLPGALLTFSGTVSNAGNVALTNVAVVNDRSGSTPVFTAARLAPGEVANFTGTFTAPTTGACSFTSTSTASGNDECVGTRVTANASATCPLATTPRIIVTKACPPNAVAQGSTLTYSGTVSNAGNITLSNIVVVDNQPAANTVVFTRTSLAPGASANFTGSFRVPNNCCNVTDTLTATGRDACTGRTVTDTTTKTCPVLFTPRITVTKSCPAKKDQPNVLEWNMPGEVLRYSGTVSNAGNITLVNVTVVNDQPSPNSLVIGPMALAPGEIFRFNGSYIVPADFCGTDTVTARGTSVCGDSNVTASATTTCPVMTTPAIAVTKNCPATPAAVGGTFTFTGTVSNIGNVTLTNVIVVNNQPSQNTRVIGPLTLAPGASTDFTGSYVVQLNCCETIDTLTASGNDRCTGNRVSATATAVCPLLSTPRIAVTQVCPAGTVPAGGLFEFSGSVSNAGDITLTNVLVFSQPNPSVPLVGPIELAPGETQDFSGSYVVAPGTNPLTNTVTATGADLCQSRLVSASANCSGTVIGVGPPFTQGPPPLINQVTVASGKATVSWTAIPGVTYCLQCKSSLRASTWKNIPGNVTATGTTASKEDPIGPEPVRIYRVMVLSE